MALAVMMKYFSSHLSRQLPGAIFTILTVAMCPDRVGCSHEWSKACFFHKQLHVAFFTEL